MDSLGGLLWSSPFLICIVLIDASDEMYLQFLVICICRILNAVYCIQILVMFWLLSPGKYISDCSVLYFAVV